MNKDLSKQNPIDRRLVVDNSIYIVTNHAIQRFIERNPNNIKGNIIKNISKLFERSFPVKLSKKDQTKRLLNNNLQESEYRYYSGWIFVIVDKKIVTIECQEDRKFGKDILRL